MENLEQVRARAALEVVKGGKKFVGAKGGEVVKKTPARIRTNGLLAAVAFAIDKGGDTGAVFEQAIMPHLKNRKLVNANNLDGFMKELSCVDSAKLREITAETLAYLNYLRRFAG